MDNKFYLVLSYLINGSPTSLLRKRITKWLLLKGDDAQIDNALKRIWDEINLTASATTDKSWGEASHRAGINFRPTCTTGHSISSPTTRLKAGLWLRIAAMVTIATLVGLGTYVATKSSQVANSAMTELFAANGTIRTLTLNDGTHVTLNSGSLLVYPEHFAGTTRTVYLMGEAFFEVAKDPDHRFIVRTHRLDITALGTQFNVKAYINEPRITSTLSEGVIRVGRTDRSGEYYTLEPNDRLAYDCTNDSVSIVRVMADDDSSWQRGEMVFIDASLIEIIKILERKFDISIRLYSDIDEQERYTLKFVNGESLNDILNIISRTNDRYRFEINGKNVALYPTNHKLKK